MHTVGQKCAQKYKKLIDEFTKNTLLEHEFVCFEPFLQKN